MIQRRQHPGFALEASQAVRVCGKRCRDHLDGDVAIELRIPGAIHLAHATGTDERLDTKRADARAWSEFHRREALFIASDIIRTRSPHAHPEAARPGFRRRSERDLCHDSDRPLGLHGLDFAFLYRNRPLWDIVAIVLLGGVGVSSVTSVMPAFRRLAKHARSFTRARSLREERRDIRSPLLDGDARR
jgi:hypothetical protein